MNGSGKIYIKHHLFLTIDRDWSPSGWWTPSINLYILDMCISLFSILELKIEARQCYLKKLLLIILNIFDVSSLECHFVLKNYRVKLFCFFHLFMFSVNYIHTFFSKVDYNDLYKDTLFVQIHFNSNLAMFFVMFFDELFWYLYFFVLLFASISLWDSYIFWHSCIF